MADIPDRVRDEDLPGLTTQELVDLYTKRRERTDFVWGQLMIRATSLGMCEQQCEKQTSLLIQCYHVLKRHKTDSPLVQRLAHYFVYTGIDVEELEQGAEQ